MTKKTLKKQQAGFKLDRNAQIVITVISAILVMVVAALIAGGGSANDAAAVDVEIPVEGLAATPQDISPAQYQAQFAEAGVEYVLIDVRTRSEFASGHITGAINIPVEELGARLSEVPQGMPIVVYCRTGNRSNQAVGILSRAGFEGLYDLGGTVGWTSAGYELVN